MAKIEFEAFVEDVLSGSSGVFGLKTAETHSRKDDQGKWQTVARTFRTVKASRDAGVSFDGFAKGDKVLVTGSEKTEVREWQGKKLYDLVVWAETVGTSQFAGQKSNSEPIIVEPSWETSPASGYTDETPF